MADHIDLSHGLITPLYAAVFGLLFVLLSVRTLLLRRRLKVGLGDGEQPLLQRAARVHANFAEYVPFALLLMVFFELQTGARAWVHGLLIGLLIGRIAHAYGVSQPAENYGFRVFGMAMTFTALISPSLRLIASYLA